MDRFSDLINSQTILWIAAIAIVFLSVRLLFKVITASFGSILTMAAIVLVMYYGFGISPNQLWLTISHLPQDLTHLMRLPINPRG